MADLQVTQEVVLELDKFYNVDLFQRGYYHIRCRVLNPPKLLSTVQCELSDEKDDVKPSSCLFKAFVDENPVCGVSKTFEVYYKHEEVAIKDRFTFKIDMLIDGNKIDVQCPQKVALQLELYFTECLRKYPSTPKSLEQANSRIVTLNLSPLHTLHAHRAVLFDYFHFAAVTLTVHSCVTAIRQPWSASLKSLHPIWGGKSGNIRVFAYNSLFGKNSPTSPSQKLDNRQKGNVSFCHRKLCLQLLKRYEQLLAYYHDALSLLPEYGKMRLSKLDINTKLDVLNSEFDLLCTAEENYTRMGDDLYLLSTELSLLWQQFHDQFTFECSLADKLKHEYHLERMNRMRQAVFTEEHAWEALCSSHELSTSQHTRMSNTVKNSLYYRLIPPLTLQCSSLDADVSSLPIIFEDKYVPGKIAEDVNDSSKEEIAVTVDETVIDGDFVDMDVSIDSTSCLMAHEDCLKTENEENVKEDDTDSDVEGAALFLDDNLDTLTRKSNFIKMYQNGILDDWDFSPSLMRQPMKETDLTGPDYSLNLNDSNDSTCHNEEAIKTSPYSDSEKSSVSDNIVSLKYKHLSILQHQPVTKQLSLPTQLRKKDKSAVKQRSFNSDSIDGKKKLGRALSSSTRFLRPQRFTNAPSSMFYAPYGESIEGRVSPKDFSDSSHSSLDSPEVAEEALCVDAAHNHFEQTNTKQQTEKIDVKLPSTNPKPKLWSCFPAIKSGSSKRNSYKMMMQASPPYMPVPQGNLSRFQRAKENLERTFNFPGHSYICTRQDVNVKEYFTEQIVATTENVHLVVCVHGLDGNRDDLRLVRCYLEMALPRANFDFLMSEVNQNDTFRDIDEMTDRLVHEIRDYIDGQSIDVVKLSFVGHSLGNIIIRNAVVHSLLFEYRAKLHTFLSLSGPHLGMQFHTSNLVSTGMWLMQKWKKGGSLVQLALNDSTDPRDTFMYRLSLTNGFQYFKNVLLVCSVQDHYVPFHSARVEMSKQVLKGNNDHGRIYKEMLDNIMNPLMVQEEVNIIRYSVYHPIPSSADSFIGRAAHIAMLDSELFLEKFVLIAASKYFA